MIFATDSGVRVIPDPRSAASSRRAIPALSKWSARNADHWAWRSGSGSGLLELVFKHKSSRG